MRVVIFCSSRSFSSLSSSSLRVCVVGSGRGFYTAEKMLKAHQGAEVDILDRLTTPFELVRSSVVPDQPKTKIQEFNSEPEKHEKKVEELERSIDLGKQLTVGCNLSEKGELLCEHKNQNMPHYSHGLCEPCYKEEDLIVDQNPQLSDVLRERERS